MYDRLSHLEEDRNSGRGVFLHYLTVSFPSPEAGKGIGGKGYMVSMVMGEAYHLLSSTAQARGGWSVSQVVAGVAVMKGRGGMTGTGVEGKPWWFLRGREGESSSCLAGLLYYVTPSCVSQKSTTLVCEIL